MSTITLTVPREGTGMNPIKLFSVCTALFTLCMIGLGSEWERKAIASIKATSIQAAPAGPATLTAAAPDASKESIVRNNFLMFLIGGGAFGGAVTCVCLRIAYATTSGKVIPRSTLGAYFTVSLMTSLFCTASVMKRWFSDSGEDCLSGSFLIAVGSWAAWEVVGIIAERIKLAATTRGIGGVKDELTGNTRDVTGVPSTASPVPNVPGSKAEKL